VTWSVHRCTVGHAFQLVATFVSCMHTIQSTQSLRQLGVTLITFLQARPANQPTITVATLCREMLDVPAVGCGVLKVAPLLKGGAVEYLPASGSCAHHVNSHARRSQ